MLARREGETLNALLKRLDKAIAKFYADGDIIDEINGPDGRSQGGTPRRSPRTGPSEYSRLTSRGWATNSPCHTGGVW
jgi:hypothetical protein